MVAIKEIVVLDFHPNYFINQDWWDSIYYKGNPLRLFRSSAKNSEKITVEADRKKAIELAIKTAAKNDIVLIAGKGHETYQIIGTQKFDFNDKAVAKECLKKHK